MVMHFFYCFLTFSTVFIVFNISVHLTWFMTKIWINVIIHNCQSSFFSLFCSNIECFTTIVLRNLFLYIFYANCNHFSAPIWTYYCLFHINFFSYFFMIMVEKFKTLFLWIHIQLITFFTSFIFFFHKFY